MNSPESTSLDNAYDMRNTSEFIKLNDNAYFDRPSCVASVINEQKGKNMFIICHFKIRTKKTQSKS